MRKLRQLISALIVSALGLSLPVLGLAHAAGVPSLYFGSTSVSAPNGSNFSLPLRLNAEGTAVNTVSVVVSFPESQMSFVNLDKAGAYFSTVEPSNPTSSNGQVKFSAASFSGPTTGDVLVGKLVFTSKASTGSGQIGLNGSMAANDGKAINITTSSATANFTAGTGHPNGLNISNINVTNIKTNTATINWQTNVPATSSVDYGASSNYGLNAGSAKLTTSHSVQLAALFAGKTKIHFKITSVTANSSNITSGDQTFTTLGYTVQIKVQNKSGQLLSGADVSVDGGAATKTNSAGLVRFNNVAPGNQKVVINGAPVQLIAVKATKGAAATNAQQFTLTAKGRLSTFLYIASGIILAILLLIVAIIIYSKNKKTGNTSAQTPQD